MPAQAKYEILIPGGSGVANRALEYAARQLAPTYAAIDTDRIVYVDGGAQYFDVLEVLVEESPQADSTMKQLGVYVAEVTGQPTVTVNKQGKGGIQVWPMQYRQKTSSVQHLPLKQVQAMWDPHVPRDSLPLHGHQAQAGLTEQIRSRGQDHPIRLRIHPSTGDWRIVDGHHRLMAHEALGSSTVPVVYDQADWHAPFDEGEWPDSTYL